MLTCFLQKKILDASTKYIKNSRFGFLMRFAFTAVPLASTEFLNTTRLFERWQFGKFLNQLLHYLLVELVSTEGARTDDCGRDVLPKNPATTCFLSSQLTDNIIGWLLFLVTCCHWDS